MSQTYQPNQEQLALAEQRKRKKEQRKQTATTEEQEKSRILDREWFKIQDVSPETTDGGDTIKVMTWNEVDRLEKLLLVLDGAGYSWVYASGPRKKHGCLIAFRRDVYTISGEKVVQYDEQEVRQTDDERARIGSSFRTKNIANIVRLKRVEPASGGVVVATTHLFWHPAYYYERARQAAILLREVTKFRNEGLSDAINWPCIIAGDFNFQPDDPAYSLLVGDPLLPAQKERLSRSRVVHVTIDPELPVAPNAASAEEEGVGTGETDPDRVIVNARSATPLDGLLTDEELTNMLRQSGNVRSTYDEGQKTLPAQLQVKLTFGGRVSIAPGRHGANEPAWTSYTHYWKAVLDYIFVLPPLDRKVQVTKLALPHRAISLQPGLPQKGVCGSDHISLCTELMIYAPST